MVFIGIDISVNSTAVCIYNGEYNLYNYTTKKPNYIWIKKVSDIVNFRFFDYEYKKLDDFSDTLVQKIKDYDNYSDSIIKDISSYVNGDVYIGIEGYNYGLVTTDSIIDISELSSIIKLKILQKFPNSNVKIIPPKSVKIESCRMVYKVMDKKKVVRNGKGVAGGSFDKIDMLNAFLDSDIDMVLKDSLIENKETILSMKNIPKPWDDLIDSVFICEIVRNFF